MKARPKGKSLQREFFANLLLIADKLGVKAEIEAVNEKNLGSFESYAAAITPIFNKAGYAWFRIAGDEYEKNNGKIGVSLRFSRFGFVASTAEGESHLKPIDPNNTYDLKKLEVIKEVEKIAKEKLLKSYKKEQEKFEKRLSKFSEKELSTLLLPHPLLGKLTLREFGYFTHYHTKHHLENIQK